MDSEVPNLSSLAWFLTAAETAAPAGQDAGSLQRLILVLGMMLFFLWFIVFRPQNKERQQRQQLLDSLKKGDRVVTVGGLHGKVADVDATHGVVSVEIAPKTVVKINRAAIASVDAKESGKALAEEEPVEKK